MSNAVIDSLTIKDFEFRYQVARSNIYNRINGLKEKGYSMEPEKQGGRSVYNADQIAVMDALDLILKDGKTISDFPAAGNAQLSYVSQDKPKPSYRTQDTRGELTATEQPALMATLMSAIAAFQPQQQNPLANLETLERVAEKGWLLSTSQLAPLVGLKSPTGKQFTRYGFTFTRAGKNGAESAWKVTKG